MAYQSGWSGQTVLLRLPLLSKLLILIWIASVGRRASFKTSNTADLRRRDVSTCAEMSEAHRSIARATA